MTSVLHLIALGGEDVRKASAGRGWMSTPPSTTRRAAWILPVFQSRLAGTTFTSTSISRVRHPRDRTWRLPEP